MCDCCECRTTIKTPTDEEIIKTLKRKLKESEAQQIHNLHFAETYITSQLTRKKMMTSGIIVELTHLGGKKVCSPFMLKNGFSDELIEAFKKDFAYSFDEGNLFKTSGSYIKKELNNAK